MVSKKTYRITTKLKRFKKSAYRVLEKEKIINILWSSKITYDNLRDKYLTILNENDYFKKRIEQLEIRNESLNRLLPDKRRYNYFMCDKCKKKLSIDKFKNMAKK